MPIPLACRVGGVHHLTREGACVADTQARGLTLLRGPSKGAPGAEAGAGRARAEAGGGDAE